MTQIMTQERFLELLADFGPELETWPDTYREEAQAALKADSLLAALLEQEARLHTLLQRREEAPDSPGLADRIISAARTMPRPPTPISFAESLRILFADLRLPSPAYVMGAVLVFGILLGFNGSTIHPSSSASMQVIGDMRSLLYDEESIL